MTADLSIIALIKEASIPVQFVMGILFLASLTSWFVIFSKRIVLGKAEEEANEFEESFWSGRDLNQLYDNINRREQTLNGMQRIFHAGFGEFMRLRMQSNMDPDTVMVGTERAMRIALNRTSEMLESNLNFLATVGSVSPYIGLFGTVWGIMNSFRALGRVQQATLPMVAPGIAEALIATAIGLFAAIPAVIAYNRYTTQAERIHNRYLAFAEEFSGLLSRDIHAKEQARTTTYIANDTSESSDH